MSDNDVKERIYNEIKVIVLVLSSILGFLAIKSSSLLIFSILVSLVLYLVVTYINVNDLRISKHVLNLILAFYNVITLLFMVQYFLDSSLDSKVYEVFLNPFVDGGAYKIVYISWVFIYSLFLVVLQSDKFRASGENYGR